jgi:RNA ligase (TIGR02306 family)
MSSTLIVQVAEVNEVKKHPDADKLEIVIVLDWQCVVPKGMYTEGQKVVYFPPDTLLPRKWADEFGVTNYLSFKDPEMGRIKGIKLRGEPSLGLIAKLDDESWPVGEIVTEHYEVQKWEAPIKTTQGDRAPSHPLMVHYTNIENLRNFPNAFENYDDEILCVTEKIHGTNSRCGYVKNQDESYELVAGSHKLQRKDPGSEESRKANRYWFPTTIPVVKKLLDHIKGMGHYQVLIFGEVYGNVIQKGFAYDTDNSLGYRAFDLFVDGKYISAEMFETICNEFDVPTVPSVLLEGFDLEKIKSMADGEGRMGKHRLDSNKIEGVVVRPWEREDTDPKIGRLILKYVGDNYLFSKHPDAKDV